MSDPSTLHIAIPAMNEAEWLPRTLEHISSESTGNVQTWICVNQPEAYWTDPDTRHICENNGQTLAFLRSLRNDNLHVIDRSSQGKGWTGKHYGVGQARKTLMDVINENARKNDLIVSMDADTTFDPGYLESIPNCFTRFPKAIALSNPYYHKLSGDDRLDRAMLRYEIYMRHYAINMWRIGSPYSFTALGSAISLPVSSYRKTGGITAKKSGEDFYFLQKLRKTGWICNHNTHKVYPATRYSDRVFFGTGPALIKGSQDDWSSYPIYHHDLFDKIRETLDCLPGLFAEKAETPMSAFLSMQFRESDPFEPLRKNSSGMERFVAACHEKIDGLRMLQFLKSEQKKLDTSDEENLKRFIKNHHPQILKTPKNNLANKGEQEKLPEEELDGLNFKTSPVPMLSTIRNILMEIEAEYQRKDTS